FTADDGTYGQELWKSDGTAAGTVLVKDIDPGSAGSDIRELTNVNGTLFFRANDGLWKSDGTAAGTVRVNGINWSNYTDPVSMTTGSGPLFFTAWNNTNGRELWKSDGTAKGTVLVKDLFPGFDSSSPVNLTAVGGTLFFTADDGTGVSKL